MATHPSLPEYVDADGHPTTPHAAPRLAASPAVAGDPVPDIARGDWTADDEPARGLSFASTRPGKLVARCVVAVLAVGALVPLAVMVTRAAIGATLP